MLDLSCFPRSGAISVLDGVPTVTGVDISSVASWYVRSLPLPLPFQPLGHELTDEPGATVEDLVARADRAYAAGRERRSFLFSFLLALERRGSVFVNPPARFSQHFLKLDQLENLRRAQIPVPRSLATNDPEAVIEFARAIPGGIVYKPLAGGGACRPVTEDDLHPERLRLLATAPVLFQEEIPGRNLRAYVVADTLVTSYEIVSAELDYRGAETSVAVMPLTEEEADASTRAARACDLTFTGIDIRRRPDGTFAVLECNPSPMFSGIERMTAESSVSRALADLLIDKPTGNTELPGIDPGSS